MSDELVPLPSPFNMEQARLAELAYELARDLLEPADVLKRFGITQEQYETYIDKDPWFKRVLEAAMIEWASTGSTKTRIQFQAALALERGLIPLTKRMINEDEDLGKAVETAKLLAKIAGLDAPATGAVTGEKFTITINLGDDQYKKEIEATVIEQPKETE